MLKLEKWATTEKYDNEEYIEWERRVLLLAQRAYGLEDEVVLSYDTCMYFDQGYTPRQAVESIADDLYER